MSGLTVNIEDQRKPLETSVPDQVRHLVPRIELKGEFRGGTTGEAADGKGGITSPDLCS
jgi:hypothetical protein